MNSRTPTQEDKQKARSYEELSPLVSNAFEALYDKDIVGEGNFSITLTDGISEIYDDEMKGYAFYHEQDTESAKAGGGLNIAFGSMKNDDKESVKIGQQVAEALEAQGLNVCWDGTTQSRIWVG